MTKWIPNRKALTGGLAGLVAYFASTFMGLSPDLATQIAGALLAVVYYFTPDSVDDIIRGVDNFVKKLGDEDNALTDAAITIRNKVAEKKASQ